MNEFIAPLGLKIDASEVAPATVSLDQLAKAGARAETAANDLAASSRKLSSAEANVAAEAQKAMAATAHLAAEQEALTRTQDRLNAAHGKVANTSKVLQQTMLNLGRQGADLGVGFTSALSSAEPLKMVFMTLAQQGPQVADAFAMASTQGLGFKAVIAGIKTEAIGLLVTFGPWIAGLAAVGGAVYLLNKNHEDAKKRIDDLNKSIEEMRKRLAETVPSLNALTNQTNLASEGSRNFADWLRKKSEGMAGYAENTRKATLALFEQQVAEAKTNASKLRSENITKNARGVNVYTGPGDGLFGLLGGVNSKAYKKYRDDQAKADQVLATAQAQLAEASKAPAAAFVAQAGATKKATQATKEHVREVGLFTDVVVAQSEIWPEHAAAVQASEKKTRDLASAQQELNKILATDRPATGLESMIEALDQSRRAAADVAYAVDDIFYSISRNDWAGAFSGLLRTIDLVKKAFDSAATSKDKLSAINAVAGVAMGVGGAVGGTAGAGISGAASGAMMGAQLGSIVPGIGTAIGAVAGGIIGGISSIFGSSSAKKKAKAEAEAQRLAAEQARIQEIANQKRSLELQLMEAQGWSFAALTASRADELAKMDASNRALAEQVYAAQDAAKTRELSLQLLEATGQAEAALSYRRHMELSALSETDQAIQKAIWAAQDQTKATEALATAQSEATAAAEAAAKALADLNSARQNDAATLVSNARANLTSAYEAEASAIEATRSKFQGFADDLKAFRLSLTSGASSAGANFFSIANKARLGDTDAMGQLVSAGQAADAAAKANASSQVEYLREQAKIRNAVQAAEETATRQVSIADQQLAALNAQVSGLMTVNASVLSVTDAIIALQSALNVQAGTFGGAVANPTRNWGANADANMLLARQTGYGGDFGSGGFQSWIESQPESVKAVARSILQAQGQAYRIGFATGGSFTVGGDGGTDTTPVGFMATRNEVVNVTKGDTMAEMVIELRALRSEVAALRADGSRTATATESAAKTLRNVTPNGDAIQTEAA